MDSLIEQFSNMCNVHNNDLVTYVYNLSIDPLLKQRLACLIENDSYTDYIQIYNICMENDIELPPI